MGTRVSRTIAGLAAVILATAILAAVFEVFPPPDWPGDYPGHDDFRTFDADVERYQASFGFYVNVSIFFICDLVPLLWIALKGAEGRKSRIMLTALAAHLVIGGALMVAARIGDEDTAIAILMLVLPLEFCWLAFYLIVLASRYLRDLLPGRVDRTGSADISG